MFFSTDNNYYLITQIIIVICVAITTEDDNMRYQAIAKHLGINSQTAVTFCGWYSLFLSGS